MAATGLSDKESFVNQRTESLVRQENDICPASQADEPHAGAGPKPATILNDCTDSQTHTQTSPICPPHCAWTCQWPSGKAVALAASPAADCSLSSCPDLGPDPRALPAPGRPGQGVGPAVHADCRGRLRPALCVLLLPAGYRATRATLLAWLELCTLSLPCSEQVGADSSTCMRQDRAAGCTHCAQQLRGGGRH